MLFNSLHFLIFFPIVIGLYFWFPHRFRWIILLISSYYFYMSWKAEYVILIFFSTLVDYLLGLKIYSEKNSKTKSMFLILSLLSNLGLLFAFKYFNFFNESLRVLLNHYSIPFDPFTLKLLLPVGISFYTFQTLSYTIDIYRGKLKPEKHFGIFAVYVSFFPQLVAGPIERAKNLLPQFFEKKYFEYKRVTDGLKLMLWGFFKKLVIADRAAIISDLIFNNVHDYVGIAYILGIFFFAFQIYCDFSGYSDIAIGSAQIMGFKLMDNFKRPYHSKSIAEFWRRWHISLSSWFEDYVFNPLYMYVSKSKVLKKISYKKKHYISFIISIFIGEILLGLWHGANWTFVIFGIYQSIFIILYYFTRKYWDKMYSPIQILLTFTIVLGGYIIFRANSVSDLIHISSNLFSFGQIYFTGQQWLTILITLMFIVFMELVHVMQIHVKMREFLSEKPIYARWTVYMLIIFAILLFGIFEQKEFIYFQF
ncbi:membrane-bound O-acyltransferase family protein [archaeon D22]|nr:membrane-bound O-acyltransferase family protein [archaeon D22]